MSLEEELRSETRRLQVRHATALRAIDEALVEWANERGWATGHGDTVLDIIRELRAESREEIKKHHLRTEQLENRINEFLDSIDE